MENSKMQDFIEKLINRLEELGWLIDTPLEEIIDELTEEYIKDTNVTINILNELKKFLKKKFDYYTEQAEIDLEVECNNSEIASYFRNRKELYLDRANIYGEVMREIDRLVEEYNNDFCEWRKYENEILFPYKTSCGTSDLYDDSYKYCPYCGKNIKVVE